MAQKEFDLGRGSTHTTTKRKEIRFIARVFLLPPFGKGSSERMQEEAKEVIMGKRRMGPRPL